MGFFSRLVSSSEMAEHKEEKNSAAARDKWIKLQKKIYPSRSIESIAAEYDASLENSPRARDKRLYEEDKQYWEDIAAGKISKDTPLPSKAYFDSLSPQEQQAETNRKQQNFQASQIRAHNNRVESLTKDIQNNIALYGKNNANTVFMETELKKLTAQQPVFAAIGAAPIVNVNVAQNVPNNGSSQLAETENDELWEQAATELESGERKEALWIKCFSQSGGDENKAKALYYEARVKQLATGAENTKEISKNQFTEPESVESKSVVPTELQKTINEEVVTTQQKAALSAAVDAQQAPVIPESSLITTKQNGSKRNLIISSLVILVLVATGVIYKTTQSDGFTDLTKLNMTEIEAYTERLNAYTNARTALSAQITAWEKTNVSFLLEKSASDAGKITAAQLDDRNYATPSEQKQLHAYALYRKTLIDKNIEVIKQAQPLWIRDNLVGKSLINLLERAVENIQKLADGKITYGEYSRNRQKNLQQYLMETKEINTKYPFPFKTN